MAPKSSDAGGGAAGLAADSGGEVQALRLGSRVPGGRTSADGVQALG